MNPIFVSIAIVLFIFALVLGLIALSGNKNESETDRRLVDNRAVIPKRRTRKELKRDTKGNYLHIGRIVPLENQHTFLLDLLLRIFHLPPRDFLLTENARTYHVVSVGKTGTGKSWMFFDMIRQDIEKEDNALFICDPQGEQTEYIIALCQNNHKNYVVLPDAGFSFTKGPGLPVERAFDLIDIYLETSGAAREGAASYYTSMVTRFVRPYFCMFEKAFGRAPTPYELELACHKAEYREIVYERVMASDEAKEYKMLIRDNWKEKDYYEFLSNFANWLVRVEYGKYAQMYNLPDAPAIGEYLDKKYVVILRNVGREKSHPEHVHGLLPMKCLEQYFNARRIGEHFIGVYIDEAHRYFLPSFMDMLNTCRKKNVAVHMAFQYFHQFGEFYNDIHESVRTMFVHPGLSAPSARIIQENAGTRKFEKTSISRPIGGAKDEGSISTTTVYDFLYKDVDIMHMREDEVFVISVEGRGLQAPIKVRKPKYERIMPAVYLEPEWKLGAPPNIYEEILSQQAQSIIDNELKGIIGDRIRWLI